MAVSKFLLIITERFFGRADSL